MPETDVTRLFVVGVGRSGTSLLHSMLAAHPAIAMLPETGFFRRYALAGQRFPAGHLDGVYDRDERLQRIRTECWRAMASQLTPQRGDVSAIRIYRELLKRETAGCIAETEPTRVQYTGDKDPRLIEYTPVLKSLFPDSWLIHIVRDPRDVLLSKTKAAWSRTRSWRKNLLVGRIHLDAGAAFGVHAFGDRYLVVKYEELITDPVAVLTDLCNRLGLSFDEQMLAFDKAASRLGGGRTEEWKKETLGPLLSANRDKWRAGLSPNQIRETEAACGRWLDAYDYERSVPSTLLTAALSLFYASGSFLYRLYRTIRNRNAAWFLKKRELQ